MKRLQICLVMILVTAGMLHTSHAGVTTPINPAGIIPELAAPAPVDVKQESVNTPGLPAPFGSNLFKSAAFVGEREDGLNPDYIIQPGDRITMNIWGAVSLNQIAVVDAQGNIFIPEVGPVNVKGVRNADLNSRITAALRQVYTENINVYTNLESTTPVLVFVTGYVNRPGSYAGVASDSLLYFLERAGGVDEARGSYRTIQLMRNGEQIAQVDLYDFLLDGKLPRPQFADGDTIVVGSRGDTVVAEGSVRNSYSFEIPATGITGKDMINMARPEANSRYATVLGSRNNQPFSTYVPFAELETIKLQDGDRVIFEVDQVHGTILVRVEGSHIGQSRFAVPRDTHLQNILDYIKVDPALADINAISIKRASLKVRQKQAIEESLRRLETAVYSRDAVTSEGAAIRAQEAALISQFVQRAREVEPQGILVVARNGAVADVLLQPDDIITIPEKTNIVQVSGEVMVPQALVFEEGNTIQDYISQVGGYSEKADKSKHMILRRSGEVVALMGNHNKIEILPGDEIISLPEVPSNSVEIARVIFDTMFKVASAAAIFIRLN